MVPELTSLSKVQKVQSKCLGTVTVTAIIADVMMVVMGDIMLEEGVMITEIAKATETRNVDGLAHQDTMVGSFAEVITRHLYPFTSIPNGMLHMPTTKQAVPAAMKAVEVHWVTLEAALAVAEAGKVAQAAPALHQASLLSQHRLRFLRELAGRFLTRNISPEARLAEG
jgi:urease alpha subunit